MKRSGVMGSLALLALTSCMLGDVKNNGMCPEAPPPDQAPPVGHVVFASVNQDAGTYTTVLVDVTNKKVTDKLVFSSLSDVQGYFAKTIALDPKGTTTLQIVMGGSPILGDVVSRPVPPPPPPPPGQDEFWLRLAQRVVDNYRLTYAEANAAFK